MKKINIKSFLFIIILLYGCNQETNDEKFSQIIRLPIGKSIYFQEKEFLIEFVAVLDDSRCKTGLVCVWEGNGRIQIFTTISETDSAYFELNTTLDPQIIEYFAYNIELIKLAPYPNVEEIVDSMKYVCTLQLQEF